MTTFPAKITQPKAQNILQRERLFILLDKAAQKPITWVCSPAGSGKTMLISSYLDARKLPCLWYQCDERDSELATFFYYMGLAAKKAAPRYKRLLPLLTPQYLAGIPVFTRRYFEQLYGRLSLTPASSARTPKGRWEKRNPPPPRGRDEEEGSFFIVLDNYQDVPADASFHEMTANGFDIIPEGVHVVVISRSDPPSAFARLHANGKIELLEYSAIRLTFDESRELAHRRIPDLDDVLIKAMHEKTDGWAAGVILMLERARLKDARTESAADFSYEEVFDYFAEEILNKTEKGLQEFLLKTAFLPVVTIPLAEKLTGVADAGRILSALNRHHNFTERLSGSGQGYRYHPLFRDFLLNRGKTQFTPDGLAAIQREAALLLEQSGQIENAASLYRDAGDLEGLTRMVIHHARELLVQGRNKTVEEWLAGIPREQADDHPWILYWSGMCFFPFDMPRTRKYLEKAFGLFRAIDDGSGIYLSWAGIVDTYAFELDEWRRIDDWITVFDDLQRTYPTFPSKEIDLVVSSRMLTALTLRRTDRPKQVERWLERVLDLLQENPSFDIYMDTLFCMSLYYLWKGEYGKNAVLLERAKAEIRYHSPPSFSVIRIKLMEGIHYWVTAQYESALSTLSEGLGISKKSGAHVFDSLLWCFRAAVEMALGNMKLAEKSLKNQMASLLGTAKTLDLFFYQINSAWHAILHGNISLAAENMEAISAKITRMGAPYYIALWNIGMAHVAFLQDRTVDAMGYIEAAHRISLSMKSHVMEWYSLLVKAYFLLKEGKRKEGLLSLRRSLSLGKRHGYVHLEFYQPTVMQFLFAKALEQGIEQEYVKGLVNKLGLAPPGPLGEGREWAEVEDWPYPVRIQTLGRFEILINEEPLTFSKKVPKKPLELVKALIAFGSTDVPVDKITDALWPEADGDAAYSSFKVNLHHLRKLLGKEQAILTGEGRISLNFQYCRVDAPVFQHVVDKILESRTGAGKSEMQEMMLLAEKAVGMYKGSFIEDEEGYPYIAVLREKLRSCFVRLVEITGTYYESQKRWDHAVKIYEKGIETDEFQEEFYRYLMLCYKRLGKYNEAESVYDRYCRMLHVHFGVEASAGMKAVYDTVITL